MQNILTDENEADRHKFNRLIIPLSLHHVVAVIDKILHESGGSDNSGCTR